VRSYLGSRLGTLRRAQNPDGGWGYFSGKQSWLEPTVYASLALAGEPSADRAWMLLKGWQGKDGSWRPSIDVAVENYGTSLCVSLAITRGETGNAVNKGVDWLLGDAGVESNWMNRVVARTGLVESERDLSLRGWPWKPGTSSWVEPTAHALVALKKAALKEAALKKTAPKQANLKFDAQALLARVRLGQAQLTDVRCRDGGWNYGSREALKVDLPSYPETTGIALVGLQGCPGLDSALDYAAREVTKTVSPLGRAWLTIALRLHGRLDKSSAPGVLSPQSPPDLQILALEALAAPGGNYAALKTEAIA
jgi:hypothetical protein